MNRLVKAYKIRRARRQQLSLERWALERAKGRARFVLSQAFTFAVLMTAFSDVYDRFFHSGPHVFHFGFGIVQYALTGIFVGYLTWADQENKYKAHRLIVARFDDRNFPR